MAVTIRQFGAHLRITDRRHYHHEPLGDELPPTQVQAKLRRSCWRTSMATEDRSQSVELVEMGGRERPNRQIVACGVDREV